MDSGIKPRDDRSRLRRRSDPGAEVESDTVVARPRKTREELLAGLDLEKVPADLPLDETMRLSGAPRRRSADKRRKRVAPPFEGSGNTVRIKGTLLGEGGMGVVHLAEQGALLRDVAAKTLRDEYLNDEFVERLTREARITGMVEHPNIVPVYALTVDERGAPLILMKRIEGVAWRDLLRDPSHEAFPDDADDRLVWHLGVLGEVCDAVAYAHSKGILHLDLKPSNVMIGAFREVYVVDWGVAASTREEHRGVLPLVDELDEVLGTPAYLPPEMVEPEGTLRLDERTDVYLLGAVLFEVLTGRPPHVGRDLHDSLCRAYESEVPALPVNVPRGLAAIVEKALAREPADRFQTVRALRSAIGDFLKHRSSSALVDTALPQLLTLRARVEQDEGDAAEMQRLFGGCHFAFSLALESWPDNRRAKDGLSETLLLLARHHVNHGDPETALALLTEIHDPGAEVAEAMGPLRARAEQAAVERRSLARFSREQDASRGREARARFFIGAAVLLNIPNLLAWVLSEVGVFHLTWYATWYYTVVLTGITGVGALLLHQEMAPNRVGKQIMWMLFAMGCFAMTTRILTAELGLPLRRGLAVDVLVFGMGCTAIGVLRDRAFWAGALVFFVTVPLVVYVPAHATLWISLAGLAGPMAVASLWIRASRRRARRQGAPASSSGRSA